MAGRGGNRAGAGRKPLPPDERLVKVAVTLPAEVVERLKGEGGGNLSRGIRHIVERSNGVFKSIILTEAEMTALDDGQGWYKMGDTVYLGIYLHDGDDDPSNPLQLEVHGETHDNWTYWKDLPEGIKQRLQAE